MLRASGLASGPAGSRPRSRGFTLVELLVSIVILGVVGLATAQLLRSVMRASSAQIAVATSQATVRTAALVLPQDLREVGYDTVQATGLVDSDLLTIGRTRLTLRAMRGLGITCGTPTLNEFRIRWPAAGRRGPQLTDGFLLFLEGDPGRAGDDQWVRMSVVTIDSASACGPHRAIALQLASPPLVDPVGGIPMAMSQHRVGGPLRWFETVEYGPYVDPGTGEAFLGMRSLSQGQLRLVPIVGPFADTMSFFFEYAGVAGPLNPTLANPKDVRSIIVALAGTADPLSLGGGGRRAVVPTTIVSRVALRNTLRP